MSDSKPTDWVESSDIGTSYAKQNGNDAEDWVKDHYDLEDRDEAICPESAHDAVDPRTGTPIEIKSCQIRDNGGRCGRFQIWDYAHDILADHGGGYIFVVHEPKVADFHVYHHRPLPASAVESMVGNWHDIDHDLRPDDAQRTDIYQTDVFSGIPERIEVPDVKEGGAATAEPAAAPDDSQMKRIKTVKQTIRKISEQHPKDWAPEGPLLAALKSEGIDERKAESALDNLAQKGEVYKPNSDGYRAL